MPRLAAAPHNDLLLNFTPGGKKFCMLTLPVFSGSKSANVAFLRCVSGTKADVGHTAQKKQAIRGKLQVSISTLVSYHMRLLRTPRVWRV